MYDVTSSYLEGQRNEIAEYGYNRDGKRGKKQIVIGLMTEVEGNPVAVEVFKGNTADCKTVSAQIKRLADSFGVGEVVLIGDRRMIKSTQVKEIEGEGFFYITAITKPEIEVLLRKNQIQMGLFDKEVVEVMGEEIRYLLRKNPVRTEEISSNRQQKLNKVKKKAEALSLKLQQHPRSKVENATKEMEELINKLEIPNWVKVSHQGRSLMVVVDEDELKKVSKLDGCYVIKTNARVEALSGTQVHDRYKDLRMVEQAFRTIKSGFLEVRPLYVRKESKTRGHVFVTMLAYLLVHEFWKSTQQLGMTLEHMIDSLDKIQTMILSLPGTQIKRIPKLSEHKNTLLNALGITLPPLSTASRSYEASTC